MVGRLIASILVFALVLPAGAQQPTLDQEPPLPVIRATTRSVLLDIAVTDKQGKTVTDLKPEDFSVKENGKAQTITSFRLEQIGREPLKNNLPAGMYTNRPEFKAPPGPLTIVLLDGLNTTVQNQQYARQQMLRYLATQFQPGLRMSVFALSNRLIQLQTFTSDSEQLRAAIERFVPGSNANSPSAAASIGNATVRQTDTSGPGADLAAMRGARGQDPGVTENAENSRRVVNQMQGSGFAGSVPIGAFIDDATPLVLDARISTTLAAMREFARITGGMSGRKNLIWISAGFPFALSPNEGTQITSGMIERANCPTCPPPLPNEAHVQATNNTVDRFRDEIRRTAAAMTASQIALYPVDARGLVGYELSQASTRGGALNAGEFSGEMVAGVASSQDNMKELASQTGGKAYYNRNDIDHAVALASEDGGRYYAISYASSNKKFNGEYRTIKVQVNRPGLQIRHRAGYFAYNTEQAGKNKGKGSSGDLSFADVTSDSTLVLFDAQVAPTAAKGGKSTFPVMFRVEPRSISWGESGKRDVDIDLFVLAVTADGKIAANTGTTVATSLDAAQYEQVAKGGLIVPVEVTLNGGDYNMRLAVRDNRTGMLGSLTVPLKVN